MKSEDQFQIRPAARIVNTLGRELIKDDLAAIVELVKNSYDADSPDVDVKFDYDDKEKTLTIIIADSGHGMSRDTVINKWLVPGTSDKLERKRSPKKKRQLQGRKGIGRYAAGILGQELFLSTIDEDGNKTELLMDWSDISSHTYLDEVDILVETNKTKDSSGTHIEIKNYLQQNTPPISITTIWPDEKLKKLKTELSKLLSPLDRNKKDRFDIKLSFGDLPSKDYSHVEIDISPLPLLELYDYRIHGSISKSGEIKLTYENQCLKPVKPEEIHVAGSKAEGELDGATCGRIEFDIRVFDRDPEAIDEIVKRAKIHNSLDMGKLEIRRWLNDFNGIGIYKGGFRIRPYGDRDYDWLNLGARRVDVPAKRIGSNQVIGLINIEPEEKSGLEEKSARDGLIENSSYALLQQRIFDVIRIVEEKRYNYRVASGRGRKLVNIEKTLESLFDFDDVAKDLEKRLKKLKVPDNEISNLKNKIYAVKQNKAKELEDIKETIAYYQGQASLGKMVGHILHEGRKPVGYLRNTLPDVASIIRKAIDNPGNNSIVKEIEDDIPYLISETEKLHTLFSSLDPFAFKKSERIRVHKLSSIIKKSIKVFEKELNNNSIIVTNTIKDDTEVYCRATELGWVFANLIENSLYWLSNSDNSNSEIVITLEKGEDFHVIKFSDNGPGVNEELLEHGRLFEPGISAKQDDSGTGMGLAIVGELIKRNHGEVWATNDDEGASFYIRLAARREAVK